MLVLLVPAALHGADGLAARVRATGSLTVALKWSVGPSCGSTVDGVVVGCKPNVYRCIGTAVQCPAFSGTPPAGWSLLSNTAAADVGAFSDASPPAGRTVNYAVTDCATDTPYGWTGACPSPGSPGAAGNTKTIYSESALSNIAVVNVLTSTMVVMVQ